MSLIGTIAGIIRTLAERRARRLALSELMQMDPARLNDLGINQQDVLEALKAPPPAGPYLEARRVAHANGPVLRAPA